MPLRSNSNKQGDVQKIIIDWTSNASQAAQEVLTRVDGVILRAQFVPGGGGTQPTNLYDVTLLDEFNQDVLAGRGADLSNVTTTSVCPAIPMTDGTTASIVPIAVSGQLTLNVANAGAAKTGQVILYVR